jgi:predicted acylesterase/phospholipase RssA
VLNHITAPNVTIASAVCASSCVPGLIEPVTLEEKGPDGTVRPCADHDLDSLDAAGAGVAAETIRMRDGSFEFDIPKHAICQMFNVHFTIVSQVGG